MTKVDWIEVGLRLLGVYFIVTGLLGFLQAIILLNKSSGLKVGGLAPGAELFLVPWAQIAAGIGLLLLKWPSNEKAGATVRKKSMPAYLENSFDQMEGENKGNQP